ncbi:CLUMA_CG003491, isoform A [Clunio marinus]|uniref:CLUMA_CG003491, isoform A n=1 Tax=Clunio marinus TaxID=568069 RepID=A0A1J1HP14_9DIPT|nr:CLUMA_CG003491, isoform A [Clunio marinus]
MTKILCLGGGGGDDRKRENEKALSTKVIMIAIQDKMTANGQGGFLYYIMNLLAVFRITESLMTQRRIILEEFTYSCCCFYLTVTSEDEKIMTQRRKKRPKHLQLNLQTFTKKNLKKV